MSNARLLGLILLLLMFVFFLLLVLPANSWLQWSSPDIICDRLIAMVVAGSLLPALDGSEPCRTPIASVRSLWTSPDFKRREFVRCGPCRTSTDGNLSAVGLAGLQPARIWALWTSPDFNRREFARWGPRWTSIGPQWPQTKSYRMPKIKSGKIPIEFY